MSHACQVGLVVLAWSKTAYTVGWMALLSIENAEVVNSKPHPTNNEPVCKSVQLRLPSFKCSLCYVYMKELMHKGIFACHLIGPRLLTRH